jgi:hypothetical protein
VLSALRIVTVAEESTSIAGVDDAVLEDGITTLPTLDPVPSSIVMSPDVEVFSGAVVLLDIVVGPAAIAGPESKATVAAVSKSARLYTSYLISNSSAGDGGPGFSQWPAPNAADSPQTSVRA